MTSFLHRFAMSSHFIKQEKYFYSNHAVRLAYILHSLQIIIKKLEFFVKANLWHGRHILKEYSNVWVFYTLFGFDTIAYSLLLKTLCCGPIAILPVEAVSERSVFFRIIP